MISILLWRLVFEAKCWVDESAVMLPEEVVVMQRSLSERYHISSWPTQTWRFRVSLSTRVCLQWVTVHLYWRYFLRTFAAGYSQPASAYVFET